MQLAWSFIKRVCLLAGGGKKATRITLGIAISIWILSIICAVPAAIGSHLKGIEDNHGNIVLQVCYPFPPWWGENYPKAMVLMKFLILYVIPLAIIAVFYMSMANHLIVSTKNVPGEVQGTQRQIKARKKVAITVLIFVLVFAICFLPNHVFMLFFYFHPMAQEYYNAFWHYLRIFGFCLCYLNSCANPVALYWVSGTFRKHFNRWVLLMLILYKKRYWSLWDNLKLKLNFKLIYYLLLFTLFVEFYYSNSFL